MSPAARRRSAAHALARLRHWGVLLAAGCAHAASAPAGAPAGAPGGNQRHAAREALNRARVLPLDVLVAARVPGLVATRAAGGELSLRLPGVEGDPLVVVDGVLLSPGPGFGSALAGVSATDVVRVRVLRPPDAAVYGPRGANGVILISTRYGRP